MVVGQEATGDSHGQGLRQKARERPAGSAGPRENLWQQTETSQNADCQILSGNNFMLILTLSNCFTIVDATLLLLVLVEND